MNDGVSGGANIVYFWRLRIHLGKVRFADSVAESARIEGLGWVYKADSGPINSARVGRGGSLRQNPIKCRHR
jgi:hypothetical protein